MDQACSYANSCAMIHRNNHIDILMAIISAREHAST